MTDYREKLIAKIMELSIKENSKMNRSELSHLNFEELKELSEKMENRI